MKLKKRKRFIILIIVGMLVIFAASPFSAPAKSLAVMSIYSLYNEQSSVMHEQGFKIKMPGGLNSSDDWFALVMTYSDPGEFASLRGEDLKLTIMYCFPGFELAKGGSKLYDTESDMYSSFYGAYAITKADGTAYGFDKSGKIIAEDIAAVPRFDFFELVLDDFGLQDADQVFEWTLDNVTENVSVAGYDGWTRLDAQLMVNGCYHEAKDNVQSYIQYGRPFISDKMKAATVNGEAMVAFAPVKLHGLIYARYFEEVNSSVFLYAVCKDEGVLERCDEQLLKATSLQF